MQEIIESLHQGGGGERVRKSASVILTSQCLYNFRPARALITSPITVQMTDANFLTPPPASPCLTSYTVIWAKTYKAIGCELTIGEITKFGVHIYAKSVALFMGGIIMNSVDLQHTQRKNLCCYLLPVQYTEETHQLRKILVKRIFGK